MPNRLLRDLDYLRSIENDNLDEVLYNTRTSSPDYSLIHEVEQTAQLEMASYLRQRYIEDRVFSNTATFSSYSLTSSVFYGQNLIEYTETGYNTGLTYSVGQRVSYDGVIYQCIATASRIIPTQTNYWTYITTDKSLYYANIPFAEWDPKSIYTQGQCVWYENQTYVALQTNKGVLPLQNLTLYSEQLDHYYDIGYSDIGRGLGYNKVPVLNNKNTDWGLTSSVLSMSGSTYSFSGILPDNTTYWTKGDNRDAQIIQYLIDITLYHIHCRINPRNIPLLRKERYDGNGPLQTGGAIGWLKRVSEARVSANLPVIIPYQGSSIMWTSPLPKQNNKF